MASSALGDPIDNRIDVILRRLDIDPGASSFGRHAADYVEAVQVCNGCKRRRSCPWLHAGSRKPVWRSCPNARLLFNLVLAGLRPLERSRMH